MRRVLRWGWFTLGGVCFVLAVGCSDGASQGGAGGTSAAGHGGHAGSGGAAGGSMGGVGHGGSVNSGGKSGGGKSGAAAAAGAEHGGTSGRAAGGTGGLTAGTGGTGNAAGTGSGATSATGGAGGAGGDEAGGAINGGEGGQAGEMGEGGATGGTQSSGGSAQGGSAQGGAGIVSGGSGGVATGGAAGTGGSGGANGTTRACCHGGTQTLNGGVWGACQGAFISAESCNGEDDDCNGQVDELGSITCGVGACATTVPACAGGAVNHCVPGSPAAGPDGCDGIDNDCDGAVDEDCNVCLHVALNGDDAAAASANGATAFRNVQPALDFAAAHPDVATRVCVAAGTACGATATYAGPAGDLTMRDGIELLGGYEATGWTRCTNSTTTLAPQTGAGVLFPASITSQTVLDGFSIARSGAATSAGVTVDGAHGALLSNLTIAGGPTVMSSYGVNVIDGGNATVVRSSIDAAPATQEMIAVRASGGTVAIEDACATAPDATTGRCTATCATSGPKISVSFQPTNTSSLPAQVHAVLLEAAPGSRIERSTVCTSESSSGGDVADVAGVAVRGDATGVVLRANTVQASISSGGQLAYYHAKVAVELQDCGGAVPRLSDNEHLELTPAAVVGQVFDGVRAAGDCHPVLDGNTSVGVTSGTWGGNVWGRAVSCEANSNVPSRCVVAGNGVRVHFGVPSLALASDPDIVNGIGVDCVGGSCTRVEGNTVTGVGDYLSSPSSSHVLVGTGVSIESAPVWVARNDIAGVEGSGTCVIDGTGIYNTSGAGRFENNVVLGARNAGSSSCYNVTQKSGDGYLGSAGPAVLSSNFIQDGICGSAVSGNDGNVIRNNILVGCSDFQGTSAVFEHNVLAPSTQAYNDLTSAAAIDALTTTHAEGTIIGTCAMTSDYHLVAGSICIDAGTPTGAPPRDMDGDQRDASPDIGPDEYAP